MKTAKAYEIEITRRNVTPAQFFAYLRKMQKSHPFMSNDFHLKDFEASGWEYDYSDATPDEHPCASERCIDKPYEKQVYIRNFDGSVYNEIVEFQFDDEEKGFGYYYTVSYEAAEEDIEANTAEELEGIAKRRLAKAEWLERKAAKIQAELDGVNEEYCAKWWLDAQRLEIRIALREAAEHRAAVEKMANSKKAA